METTDDLVGMDMETATIETAINEEQLTDEEIVRFIDTWLDDHSWKLDSSIVDFALDLRTLIAQRSN